MTIYYTTIHYKLSCHLWIWHFLIAVNPCWHHYSDAIMSVTASQITSVSVVYLYRLFRRRSKKTSKLHFTGLCEGNSPVTGEFPSQRASNSEDFFHLMTSSWLHFRHFMSDLLLMNRCIYFLPIHRYTSYEKKTLKVYTFFQHSYR